MTDIPEVTGRDDYIIVQALYEFIRLEQSKPLAERRGQMSRTQRPSCTRGLTRNWRSYCNLTKWLAVSLPIVRGR
jgi:hypothetical protein